MTRKPIDSEEELTTFYLAYRDSGIKHIAYGEWKDRDAAEFFANSADMIVLGTERPDGFDGDER